MELYTNEEIKFSISGKAYKSLRAFEKEHSRCIDDFSDCTGAQYEYNFIPTSLGMLTSVQCSCGDMLLLSDDSNDAQIMAKRRKEKINNDAKTQEIIQMLFSIHKRPGMFFGKPPYIENVTIYICGISNALRLVAEEICWLRIYDRLWDRVIRKTRGMEPTPLSERLLVLAGSNEAAFDLFFVELTQCLKEDFPEVFLAFTEQA